MPDVCHQKLARDRHAPEGPPTVALDLGTAVVRPVTRDFARHLILRHEYLGTMGPSTRHHGLFFGEFCGGVACYAIGSGTAGPTLAARFGLSRNEVAVLCRGCCVHWCPPNANSRLIAESVRHLASDEPAVRLVVGFSDPEAGEIGTVYQACGWAYTGRTTARPSDLIVSPQGRAENRRKIGLWAASRGLSFAEMRDRLTDAGWTFRAGSSKHRYARVIDPGDSELTARVDAMRKPYPKREPACGDP